MGVVGPDTPAEMVGRRVGVKYVLITVYKSVLWWDELTRCLSRWLYKTCMKCPTCKVQYTNCRNQDNSGRVSIFHPSLPSELMLMMVTERSWDIPT